MPHSQPPSRPQSGKLPKHIAQMVEKNNLVLAIKELASEQGISMGDAKVQIDAYEAKLKQQHAKKTQAIVKKQNKPLTNKLTNSAEKLYNSVDSQLNTMGYKKPLIPYWAKRILIILIICAILTGLFYWKLLY
ncbi:hypothetical protein [Psychrobacter lutiphocae]|uniref:hypothetical protein n=1 Tax=Psychrobacter lutiphocae TaxID=540500 RepID=UPI00036ECDD7|nr:hypothetical protein [Psychrobacter lutiphocae]